MKHTMEGLSVKKIMLLLVSAVLAFSFSSLAVNATLPDIQVRIAAQKSVSYREAAKAFSLPAFGESVWMAVTDFGAIPGDSEDDSASLQQALRSAGYGGTVFFPAGEYLISSCLEYQQGQTLVFEDGAVLKRSDASCGCLLSNGGESVATVIVGAVLDGNEAIASPLIHFTASQTDGLTLLGCVFRNGYSQHYVELQAAKNTKIIGCTFEDTFRNPESRYEYVHLAAMNPLPDGEAQENAVCSGLLVSHCLFVNQERNNCVAIGSRETAPNQNIRIQQCTFLNWDMAMGAVSFGNSTRDAMVYGCQFVNCRSGVMCSKGENLYVSVDNKFVNTRNPIKGKVSWALEDSLSQPVLIPLLDAPQQVETLPLLSSETLEDGSLHLLFSEPVRLCDATLVLGGGEKLLAASTPGVLVRVTDFGAVPNDEADDSRAIQDALDAAKEGGVVYFPSGTYMIAKATAFYSGQTLLFEEGAVLKRHKDSPLGHLLMNWFDEGVGGYYACQNVNIIGAVFDGNAEVDKSNNMMNLIHTRHVNLINCRFRNGNYWHYIEANSSADLSITGCVFEDSYYNLQTRSEYLQIDRAGNGSFSTTDKAVYQQLFSNPGPYFDDTICFHVLVNACQFDSRNSGAVLFGNHSDATHQYVHVQSCEFLGGSSSRGCVCFAKQPEHFTFTNNLFSGCTMGLFCTKGTDLVVYADNEFQNIKTPAAGAFTISEQNGALRSVAGIAENCSVSQENEYTLILRNVETCEHLWLFGLQDAQGNVLDIMNIR